MGQPSSPVGAYATTATTKKNITQPSPTAGNGGGGVSEQRTEDAKSIVCSIVWCGLRLRCGPCTGRANINTRKHTSNPKMSYCKHKRITWTQSHRHVMSYANACAYFWYTHGHNRKMGKQWASLATTQYVMFQRVRMCVLCTMFSQVLHGR